MPEATRHTAPRSSPASIQLPDTPAALRRDAAEFRRALRGLVRAHQARDRELAGSYGLSPSAAYALQALVRLGDVRIGDLADELLIEKSTASRLVAGLKEKEYVETVRDPDDGRVQRLRLTGKGRAVQLRLEEDALDEFEGILRPFGAGTRRALTRRLRQLVRNATAR